MLCVSEGQEMWPCSLSGSGPSYSSSVQPRRGTELSLQPQPPRLSPRAPLHLKTTNSESNGAQTHTHQRGSPKLEDNHRRSPRSPLPERKRGSKVNDLETKLGHVQDELKKLREQLASAEAAKRDAQHELQEAKKKLPTTVPSAAGEQAGEERYISAEIQQDDEEGIEEPFTGASTAPEEGKIIPADSSEVISPAPAADLALAKGGDMHDDLVLGSAVMENEGSEVIDWGECKEAPVVVPEVEEAPQKESQVSASELEAKLEEKLKELEKCMSENASLKKQLAEAEAFASAARNKEEEATLKLTNVAQELAGSKAKADQLAEQLEAAEGAKSSLEAEMKKLKIQTEQWRKAADAAVAALSVTGGLGADAGGRRVGERCGSMDKHIHTGEFSGLGSPLMGEESDDERGGAKRKGGGIRMFGDLWKKKNPHQQK